MSAAPAPISTPISLKDEAIKPLRSPLQDTIRRILRSRSAVIGLVMISILVLLAIFADVISTHNPIQSMLEIPGESIPGVRLPAKAPCVPAFGCSDPAHLMGLDLNARVLQPPLMARAFAQMLACRPIRRGLHAGGSSGYTGGVPRRF